MSLENTTQRIFIFLKHLAEEQENTQTPEHIIQQAKESGGIKFRLLAKVNDSGLQIMEWCDDAFNFSGMVSKPSTKKEEYHKNTYSLDELTDVVENCLKWVNGVKEQRDYLFYELKVHLQVIE